MNLLVGSDRIREQFTGKEYDKEAGVNLYYFGKRYYDPKVGIWTSTDPDKQFLNAYLYCEWNPINITDPDGARIDWGNDKLSSHDKAIRETFCRSI